jgi:4,5-DOPA dioxygenase extradiol
LGEDREAAELTTTPAMTALPAIFVSHGAPTLAIESSPARDFLVALGREIDSRFGRPQAIVAVSAHWETSVSAASTAASPAAIHDFGGFPDELYRMRYPAPGASATARDVVGRLAAAGVEATTDRDRGLDHGAWVPLCLMYPEADVPVTQLSIQPSRDPRYHHRIGEALRPVREEGVLLLGSGSITHNLRELSARPAEEAPHVRQFVDWIADRAEMGDTASLLDYRRLAPHAERNHPTGEHLLPLFVVLGAASSQRLRRIHASVTFGSLRMDAFATD